MGATAFFAKVAKKGKGKDKKSEDKFKKHCTHCKIHGHDVSECCKLKKEQEAKGGTSNTFSLKLTASAKVANTNSTPANTTVQLFTACINDPPNSDESAHAFQALSAPNLQHQWLLDSGASCTMSSNCNWFHSFTPLPTPIQVILGDDSVINTTGTG
jgi:Pol polyprotein